MSSSTGTVVFNDSRIKATGVIATESIGVGTANPTSNLHAVGDASIQSNLEVGTANLFVDTTTGNVGVGTTDPNDKLHVNGHIRVASNKALTLLSTDTLTYDGDSMPNYGVLWRTHTVYPDAPTMQMSGYGGIRMFTQANERVTILNNGNVGIGTDSPMNTGLHVANSYFASGGNTDHFNPQIFITGDSGTSGDQVSAIGFSGNSTADAHQRMVAGSVYYKGTGTSNYGMDGYLGIAVADTSTGGADPYGLTEGELASHTRLAIKNNGRVGIGVTNPDAILDVRSGTEIPRLRGDAGRSLFMGSNYTHVNSTGFSETNGAYAWDGYPGVVRMNSGGEYRIHGQTGTYTVTVRADGGFATFTGSHDTFTPFSEDDVGKIVYSTGNYATEVKDENVNGVIYDYLTIMDSCPVVKICATENDKRVMGVLSTRQERTQIEEITKEEYELITGDERYAYEKKEDSNVYIRDIDTGEFSRGYYNAVGEGGIWVCNKNGNFENGDYITSSTVAGYGQKQNDDLLHNYTVAKITTDCDFSEIWLTTKKHKKTREGYLFDENNEPVYENILDTEGNTRKHLKFKLRYLLPDGTQISEEEYTAKTLADEKVYIAAFVGCTYHCG